MTASNLVYKHSDGVNDQSERCLHLTSVNAHFRGLSGWDPNQYL